jgi:hypothetical protein
MVKNSKNLKTGIIVVVCIMLVASFSQVFAGGHWGGRHFGSHWGAHWGGAYIGWGYAGCPYYYNDPYYYHRNYVIIDRYDTVVVKKNAPAPQAQSAIGDSVMPKPSLAEGDTVTINIPNSSGNFTAIKLVRHGDGYTGPQGENYPLHPTVAQLQVLYGK